MVHAVLTATPIHMMIALELPKWVIKAINKRRRCFLGVVRRERMGEIDLVSQEKVQRPLEYGGLGIHNLESLECAPHIRWLWAQKIDPTRPWFGLPIQVSHNSRALFDAAVVSIVGDGGSILFQSDMWLNGKGIQKLAPSHHKLIPKRTVRTRMVAQALFDRTWVHDTRGSLFVQVLVEYFLIQDQMDNVELLQNVPDILRWKLTQSGTYNNKSAYDVFFLDSTRFGPWKRIWKTWAPMPFHFFIWLAINNRCQTADRLAKRGLPHSDVCTLCDQDEESISHILISYVFTQQIWHIILQHLGLAALALLVTSYDARILHKIHVLVSDTVSYTDTSWILPDTYHRIRVTQVTSSRFNA